MNWIQDSKMTHSNWRSFSKVCLELEALIRNWHCFITQWVDSLSLKCCLYDLQIWWQPAFSFFDCPKHSNFLHQENCIVQNLEKRSYLYQKLQNFCNFDYSSMWRWKIASWLLSWHLNCWSFAYLFQGLDLFACCSW